MMDSCQMVNSIHDVIMQYNARDEHPSGSYDSSFVSCGVIGKFVQLEKILKEYQFDLHVESQTIAKVMCHCCKTLKPNGDELVTWERFFECMQENGIKVKPKKHNKEEHSADFDR